jgi:hypothetical protein
METWFGGSIASAGNVTVGVYWGGVTGSLLAQTTGVGGPQSIGTTPVFADLYWQSNTEVAIGVYFPTQSNFSSSIVTGLISTINKVLTFGAVINHTGSATVTPLLSYVNQVH